MTASRPLFLGFLLLIGLYGCGPVPSDEASHLGASASQSVGTGTSGDCSDSGDRHAAAASQSPCAGASPQGPVSTPSPLASRPAPAEPREAQPLVIPDWMAQALASPDVRVRLTALDRWGTQQGPNAPLDPLVVALDDEDEQVRAKAMELFERAWAHSGERIANSQERIAQNALL